ncbi:MAG: hypothetical protein QM674_07580 [Burkholderiaceae bacterium]
MGSIAVHRETRSPPRRGERIVAERVPDQDDYDAFVRRTLPQQQSSVASHRIGGQRVWLKKAGRRHGRLAYRLLAMVACMLGLDTLTPVPNPGGEAAIAIEERRLRELGELGLRVPRVLTRTPQALLISDLGRNGHRAVVFNEWLEQAAASGPEALLAAWNEGLWAIAAVHARGAYLSQAFARNLVHCPDGEVGFIDFEDDPGQILSIAECQARDWLSYLHSTAPLLCASQPEGAGRAWRAGLARADPAVRERIALAARRVRWLRKLPGDRRWGRDTQRLRAAARLLAQWYPDA